MQAEKKLDMDFQQLDYGRGKKSGFKDEEPPEPIDIEGTVADILEKDGAARIYNKYLVLEFWRRNNLFLSPSQQQRFLEMPGERTITNARAKLGAKFKPPKHNNKKGVKRKLSFVEAVFARLWR